MSVYSELSFDQLFKLAQTLTYDLDGLDSARRGPLRELHVDLYDELHIRALALADVEKRIAATPLLGFRKTDLIREATERLRQTDALKETSCLAPARVAP